MRYGRILWYRWSMAMGLELVRTGRCPLGLVNPMACWFCAFGHATDCHYPETCEEAECSHCEVQGGAD